MIMRIPEAAISCYLIIFLMKQDAVLNCVMGLGLIVLATGVVGLMIPIINASIDSPAMRIAVMFVSSYIFLFLSSTTPLGEQAAIVGLIVAFVMTLVPMVPIGQIADQGLLMAWKMVFMPMSLMILFNLVLGRPAQTHVRNKISERLLAAADEIVAPEQTKTFAVLLGEGNDLPLQQMLTVKLLHLVRKDRACWLNGAVDTSYRILIAAQARPAFATHARREELAVQLRATAKVIVDGKVPPEPESHSKAKDPAERLLQDALTGLSQADGGGNPRPRMIPLLVADAFTNSDHQRYALKTSIAAVLCYLIYTGLQWDGIHTAMITCYVAALGTIGETVRKLSLRIAGCLIGVAMGVFCLAVVMPHLTSIGGLMIMVFCGVFVGAWVSSGNERIYYGGVQIALAFLLTILNGFGPSFDISQASNRIYGILLGIFVIYMIFTQFWPRSVIKEVKVRMLDALNAVIGLKSLPDDDLRSRTEAMAAAQVALSKAEELLDMAPFEPAHLRVNSEQMNCFMQVVEEIRDHSVRLYLGHLDDTGIARRLGALKTGLSAETWPQPEDIALFVCDDLVHGSVNYSVGEQALTRIE